MAPEVAPDNNRSTRYPGRDSWQSPSLAEISRRDRSAPLSLTRSGDLMHVTDVDTAHARRWLGLAVGVLILAGLFALLLVLARMPPFDRFVTDPDFFRRCLVVHVNLSLVLWFYSFIAALLFILPAHPRTGGLARASLPLGVLGVVMMGIAAWIPGSDAGARGIPG